MDATSRREFADIDLVAGLSTTSSRRPAVIADMPLDASHRHVYAVTVSRVSTRSHRIHCGVNLPVA